MQPLIVVATVVAAAAAVVFVDRRTARSGLLPPGFRSSIPGTPSVRRILAGLLLVTVFWLGIFLPIASLGGPESDLSGVSRAQLFLLHAVFLGALGCWYALAFVATEPAGSVVPSSGPETATAGSRQGTRFGRQFGLTAPNVLRELGIGLAAGIAAWIAVLMILLLLGLMIWKFGGEEALPRQPPAIVPWIAALPIVLRVAISLSAGFAEEIFFRGFLQPRAGVAFSTFLFVLAHAGYGQPLMLVGVTLLSLVFAGLVRWRQNIWAAVVAHAAFDAIQLLVVIPMALKFLEAAPLLPGRPLC
ncbi:MAG: CPBP family intramembrane glutamic endopeptidase [Thermoanaerobaculia bacterium]